MGIGAFPQPVARMAPGEGEARGRNHRPFGGFGGGRYQHREIAVPVTVTFDIVQPTPPELNRIRGFFERLGWEHLGNTAYRYPKLHGQHPTEDWFNHVIPALMMLRAFARHAATTGRNIRKFSIDVQSSTGFDPITNVGIPPLLA